VDCGEPRGLSVGDYRGVSVVAVSAVVVRCGWLMLRHGHGGNVLLSVLHLREPGWRVVVGCPVV
jgi:hypothetical protein